MKTRVNLQEVTVDATGVKLAKVTIDMCSVKYRSNSVIRIKANVTHHVVKITSSHCIGDLKFIVENLQEDKVRAFAKEKLAAHKVLNSPLTINN